MDHVLPKGHGSMEHLMEVEVAESESESESRSRQRPEPSLTASHAVPDL